MLYSFQTTGSRWLAEHPDRNAALCDDMGMGKTITASHATGMMHGGIVRVLTIAPASALENWRREYREFGTGGVFAPMSYADPRLADVRGADWDVVILDEAHYCKNPRSRRSRRALRVAREAGRAWALSGTLMPNYPDELYALFAALWPFALRELEIRSYAEWVRRFCVVVRSPWGDKIVGERNADQLAPYLRRVALRRTLDDVALELPPLRVSLHWLSDDRAVDRAVRDAGLDPARLRRQIEGEEAADEGVSRLRRLLGELKAPRVARLIAEELEDRRYQKIVVGAYHRSVLDTLERGLSRFGVCRVDGSTPTRLRQRLVDTFTGDSGFRVFLGQMTAAGVALNLQVAHECAIVEPDWSPGVNVQFVKRIHRIGTGSACRARLFAVPRSLDEGVMQTVERKIKTRLKLEI